MGTPSFQFRLERVRSLRERAEEAVREELARELNHRVRGEALLREATQAVQAAHAAGRTGADDERRRPGRRPVDMAVEIGRTTMTIGETPAVSPGSIITLNRLAGSACGAEPPAE